MFENLVIFVIAFIIGSGLTLLFRYIISPWWTKKELRLDTEKEKLIAKLAQYDGAPTTLMGIRKCILESPGAINCLVFDDPEHRPGVVLILIIAEKGTTKSWRISLVDKTRKHLPVGVDARFHFLWIDLITEGGIFYRVSNKDTVFT